MYSLLYTVYELACAYSTQAFVFLFLKRDLLIQLFLGPLPRSLSDPWLRSIFCLSSSCLQVRGTLKKIIKESICFPTLDRQIRVQTRGVGGAGALSAGAAPRNPGHIWDSTSVPATHPPALFDSPSAPVPWFEYSVEKMSVFGNKQTCKQTTQAIVIVLLSDASLRRLWKRASPESFKTWYQT